MALSVCEERIKVILSHVPITIGEQFKKVVDTVEDKPCFIRCLYNTITGASQGFYYRMKPGETEETVTASIEALDLLEGFIITTTLKERDDVNDCIRWHIKRIREVKENEKVL